MFAIFLLTLIVPPAFCFGVTMAMPGRKSLTVATALFLIFAAWVYQSILDYGEGRFGEGIFLVYSVTVSTVLGTAIRLALLYQKRGTQILEEWSVGDNAILACLLIGWIFKAVIGPSGVCLMEGRKLSDDELAKAYIGENSSSYYWVSPSRPNIFGSYRANISTVPSSGVGEASVELNACGKPVSKPLRMSDEHPDLKYYKQFPKK